MNPINRRNFLQKCVGAGTCGLFALSSVPAFSRTNAATFLLGRRLTLQSSSPWGIERAAFLQKLVKAQTHDLFALPALDRLPMTQKLEEVNRAVNRIPYASDQSVYGREDLWADPVLFRQKGGDCEDFALSKFACLTDLAVAPDDMFLIGVKHIYSHQAHACLAVKTPENGVVILDNASNVIKTDWHFRKTYRLIYAQSVHGLWQPA
ncbi:transglutaminase-like cysteine peptidase [Terasakiella pusilla]|jgi:predicted transglutaminase-like cysteine proteinase|uniref:transglutaminase-like cysteine peptidase n=1 Tax=Terasakiella pusilla TaxID=64973 RepID=UPI00068B3B47|nr:transglutaminase-like cysteine peptidase [Terasakiella pusilla]